jgi:hypothetical protein
MGTATQFEQATVETTGDKSQTMRGKSSGTEGQGDANFVDLENETEKKEARKEIVPRSSVWDHFIKIKDEKGRLKSKFDKDPKQGTLQATRGEAPSTWRFNQNSLS